MTPWPFFQVTLCIYSTTGTALSKANSSICWLFCALLSQTLSLVLHKHMNKIYICSSVQASVCSIQSACWIVDNSNSLVHLKPAEAFCYTPSLTPTLIISGSFPAFSGVLITFTCVFQAAVSLLHFPDVILWFLLTPAHSAAATQSCVLHFCFHSSVLKSVHQSVIFLSRWNSVSQTLLLGLTKNLLKA